MKPSAIPVITIDGPTASGKGTVACRVAAVLGWHVLDSGALYRLTALTCIKRGIGIHQVGQIADAAAYLDVVFKGDEILMHGQDVTAAIRQEAVGEFASRVAALEPVRAALLARQREFRQAPGLVADGRDMGTVVFPDAHLKVFLIASARARAERRYKQLIEKGFSANIDEISRDLEARDARDSQRLHAPLTPAQDALRLDSSALDVDQTVNQVLDWYKDRTQAVQ
ncbi:(d)CMP kinase [Pigmentiphaga aceris]|uniref:Cytidylate kinase n=1 Tax=Pigmentiphaga aceris TaxID=1940612 RepID=A0A5C0AT01_9BURK|nr:(d)CMP kinase [Pigmentiphaga aceris]QEI05449.1 (d)CMP kinase [Pigmentiphaga aceris]